MSSQLQKLKELHFAEELLVLPNVWDARSASLVEQSGFKAIATSSSAVAKSMGYQDGEGMPFDDYVFVINRILSSVSLPVTVDLEMGYGKTADDVFRNISRIAELGVSGVNLEDSIISDSKRTLLDADIFAKKLSSIKNSLSKSGIEFFINVRCDTYILDVPNKREEAARRAKLYESEGADGLFLPFIKDPADIEAAVSSTKLPLNVMSVAGLPDFKSLSNLGVRRLSMGPFLCESVYGKVKPILERVKEVKSDATLFV